MYKTPLLFISILLSTPIFAQNDKPIKVEVRKTGDKFQLFRGGQPYYIKGAGGYDHFDMLAQCGGNSIRIWGHEQAKDILDEAQKLGLTVTVGLWVAQERHGFDYNDGDAVDEQLRKFKVIVEQLKDHPALLLWGIGNEVNLSYTNMNVWYAIDGIAKMIHEVDPNHPTMTAISSIHENDVRMIKERCPNIDILGINTYAGVINVPDKIREYEWDRSYIITEWGPTGHWEIEKTDWEAPIEQTSTEKANLCRSRYESAILKDSTKCLGSYVFKWGNKQEMTATWYSTILESGEKTEMVNVMQHLWTGKWPTNRTPRLESFVLNNKTAKENVRLIRMELYKAKVKAVDTDNDSLRYEWEVIPESKDLKEGGDQEDKPFTLEDTYKTNGQNELTFKAPRRSGAYRLFVYVYDGHNNVATANIPFLVKK